MPVNTAALKTFAPAMRRQLLEAVGRGMWETPEPATLAALRQVLLETEGDLEAR